MRKLFLTVSIVVVLVVSLVFALPVAAEPFRVRFSLASNVPVQSLSWTCVARGAQLSWGGFTGITVAFPGGSSTTNGLGLGSGVLTYLKGDGVYAVTQAVIIQSPSPNYVYALNLLGNPVSGILTNGLPGTIVYPSITCASAVVVQDVPGLPINQYEADNGITRPALTSASGAAVVVARQANGDLNVLREDPAGSGKWVQVFYVSASALTTCATGATCFTFTNLEPPSAGWRSVVTRQVDGKYKFEIFKPDGTPSSSFLVSL